eukprot:545669_1
MADSFKQLTENYIARYQKLRNDKNRPTVSLIRTSGAQLGRTDATARNEALHKRGFLIVYQPIWCRWNREFSKTFSHMICCAPLGNLDGCFFSSTADGQLRTQNITKSRTVYAVCKICKTIIKNLNEQKKHRHNKLRVVLKQYPKKLHKILNIYTFITNNYETKNYLIDFQYTTDRLIFHYKHMINGLKLSE